MFRIKVTKNNVDLLQWAVRLNLILGFYNLYMYVQSDFWFNFLVGALNIGVWVFMRKPISNIINKQKQ